MSGGHAHQPAAVPFFGAQRAFATHEAALAGRFGEVLRSGQVLGGTAIRDLEARLARATGRKAAVAVSSGTDALHLALRAAGIGPGDEVLVPALSFIASASAVLQAQAEPVFADVDGYGLLDLADAAARVTPRTKAVVAVDLYGRGLDGDALAAFARRHGLVVVKDCAQAFGTWVGGKPAAAVGDAACLSFDPTKTVAAPGSGGAVVCDDAALAETLRQLRYHGRDAAGRYAILGYNCQMATATAAILDYELDWDAAWHAARQDVATVYRHTLPAEATGLMAAPAEANTRHSYHKFVLAVAPSRREAIRAQLREAGVPTAIHYPAILPDHPVFAERVTAQAPWPQAQRLSGCVLSLPIHAFLTREEVQHVATTAAASLAADPAD